ncbi:MAG: C40 family peptidase [Clostridia bacterium]|nr:C40 family peptidase [Clostridia bacterium]
MGEKDIKMKPTTMPKVVNSKPKVAVKSKDAIVNTVKDVKSVARDALIKKAVNKETLKENGGEHLQKADTEAAESVENTSFAASDAAYRKGKAFVKERIEQNKLKTREQAEGKQPDIHNEPKTEGFSENNAKDSKPKVTDGKPKTKEEYLKSQSKQPTQKDISAKKIDIKTKENYIKGHSNETVSERIKGKNEYSVDKMKPKSAMEARREYVTDKLKKTKEAEKRAEMQNISAHGDNGLHTSEQAKPQIKTKESYLSELQRERIEPKQISRSAPRGRTNLRYNVKTRNAINGNAKNAVKSGSIYSNKTIKKKNVKSTKRAAKTQKEVSKKAAKEAAKSAKQAAQKAAQVTKAAAKKARKITIKLTKLAVKAVTKLITALVAAGGWAVLIVALIVIIIVGAVAASPFGIFISKEVSDVGTVPLSQIIGECNAELTQIVENIELSVAHDDVEIVNNQTNTNLILAVFAAKTAGVDDNTAEDVVVFDAGKAEKLKDVFRRANEVNYTTSSYTDDAGNTKTRLTITITGKTKEELFSMYSLSRKQQEAVDALLEDSDALASSSQSLAITDANVNAVVQGLPSSLPQKRKDVVKNAASLVGKVNYFWGGKSSAIGWDSAWGTMQRVSAAGSPSSGTIRAYGLDCSGFVTWAFNNSGMGVAVGHGTLGQKAASTLVDASSVQAGDLAFNSGYTHVGIVVGRDTSGNILVIHCSSGANNVVLATASSVGFTIFRRPNCY